MIILRAFTKWRRLVRRVASSQLLGPAPPLAREPGKRAGALPFGRQKRHLLSVRVDDHDGRHARPSPGSKRAHLHATPHAVAPLERRGERVVPVKGEPVALVSKQASKAGEHCHTSTSNYPLTAPQYRHAGPPYLLTYLLLLLALGAVEMSLRRLGGKVARDEDNVGRVDKLLVELPQRWREAPEQP